MTADEKLQRFMLINACYDVSSELADATMKATSNQDIKLINEIGINLRLEIITQKKLTEQDYRADVAALQIMETNAKRIDNIT